MGRSQTPVLITGIVPTGPSGVRDYGDLLGEELRRRGLDVRVTWTTNDPRRATAALLANVRFLRKVRAVDPGTCVVLNHAPMSTGYRGVPGPATLGGIVARRRGLRVIGVVHEIAEPWRRQGWRARLRSLTQAAALPLLVLGSDEIVVTTERRRRIIGRVAAPLRRPVTFLPVFSNFGRARRPRSSQPSIFTIAVLDHGAAFARPQPVVEALARLRADGPAKLVLVGMPDGSSPAVRRWLAAAEEVGVAGAVTATGFLSRDDFSEALRAADVVVLPNAQGPSPRKGTLAAALAHGRPVVTLDGPNRWVRLVSSGAVTVVADATRLADVLRQLRADASACERLGARAAAFYDEAMDVTVVGGAIAALVHRLSPPVQP